MSLGKEITMTVPYSSTSGYGFLIDGSRKPLRVSLVEKDSSSQMAGLMTDDLLLMVNGHNVKDSILQTVQSIISYSTGSPLTLKVARPQISESKAKVNQASSLNAYQAAVGDAMRSAQDAFDLLGLSPSKNKDREEKEFSIELDANPSDSDQSFPPSSRSEDDEREEPDEDPIMDFTRGSDEFTHDSQGHFSAAMVGGIIRAQQALQGIKDLSASTKPKATQPKPQVSSEGSIEIGRRPLKVKEVSNEAPVPVVKGRDQSGVRIEVSVADSKRSGSVVEKAPTRHEEVIEPPLIPPSRSVPPVSPQPQTAVIHQDMKSHPSMPPSVPPHSPSSFPPSPSLPPTVSPHSPSSLPPPSLPPSLPPPTVPPSSLPPPPPSSSQHSSNDVFSPPSNPPPIPPYNPVVPDTFLLSNRPEYQLQVKKQMHSYEDVSLQLKSPSQDEAPPTAPPSSGVVLRSKGRGVAKKTDVEDLEMGGASVPTPPPPVIVTESPLDPLKASYGLPASVHTWKISHVLTWLSQLNSSLSDLYNHCFTQHSITGHTLLHLNQSKLQYIGIDNKDHRTLLGMAIARLRLHHEQKELERLTGQVSWL